MRLLFVTSHTYLPERVGGAESSTHELASELMAAGCEVAVLAKAEQPRGTASQPRADSVMGYPVWRLATPLERLSDIAREWNAAWIIGGHELARHVDALKQIGSRTCIYFRDVEFGPSAWRLSEIPGAVFLANSQFVARRASQLFNVQPTKILPLIKRVRYEVPRQGKNIVFVNPVPKKGFEIALQIARRRPNIAFDFVEAWPLTVDQRAYLRSRVSTVTNVTWLASCLDMRSVYSRARIVLVPSIWEEAWGRVVSEAQISGIPTVVSGRGGLEEAVGTGGVLVKDFGNPDAWLAALDALDDPALYEKVSAAAIESSRRTELDCHVITSRFLGALCNLPGLSDLEHALA